MDIQSALGKLNLPQREAQLYVTLLEMGKGTPLLLAKRTGLKRPTVYLDLDSLKRKRLVTMAFQGKKVVYIPESPERLLEMAQQQEKAIAEALPLLQAIHTDSKTAKPEIRYYEGLDNVERIWAEETFQAKESWYISHVAELNKLFAALFVQFEKLMQSGVIKKTREVVTTDPIDVAYANKRNSKNRQIRVMPVPLKFHFDISIWKSSVGLFSIKDRSILVLTGQPIAESFRSLHELAWRASLEPSELRKAPRGRKA